MANGAYLVDEMPEGKEEVPTFSGAPRPAPPPIMLGDAQGLFEGSISPAMQQSVAFVRTQVSSPQIPKFSLMPPAINGNPTTNAAVQSTATQTVIPTPAPTTAFYQTVQDDGTSLTQRPRLNFLLPIEVVDDPGNSSTDVSVPVFGASGPNHSEGLVPDPGSIAGTTRFLNESGVWEAVNSIPYVVYVNGGGEAINKLYFVDGVNTGAAAWLTFVNGAAA
jgi:hypothetical protein